MIKLGLKEESYMANSTWFCLTCSACSGRCPREIDIPAVMEAIRHLAIEEKRSAGFPKSKRYSPVPRDIPGNDQALWPELRIAYDGRIQYPHKELVQGYASCAESAF